MTTTTIYLSAAGVVVNDTPTSEYWSDWRNTNSDLSPDFYYSPAMIEELNALFAREDVTLRWLTAWNDAALKSLCQATGLQADQAFQVPEIETKGQRKLSKSNSAHWWKLDAFKSDIMIAPLKRLIWLDPCIDDYTDSIDNWLDPYGVLEHNRLYLAPDEILSSDDIEQMHHFLSE